MITLVQVRRDKFETCAYTYGDDDRVVNDTSSTRQWHGRMTAQIPASRQNICAAMQRRKACCQPNASLAAAAPAGRGAADHVPCAAQEETLLPACKKRVAMAVQLDKVVHADSKQNADHKWMLQAAADLGAPT